VNRLEQPCEGVGAVLVQSYLPCTGGGVGVSLLCEARAVVALHLLPIAITDAPEFLIFIDSTAISMQTAQDTP
jgi:hypothetical protein